MKIKYKYIYFEEILRLQTGKTKHYNCRNNQTEDSLGIVEWERHWRQYVFNPSSTSIIFSVGCLLDIVDFIKQLK